MNFYHSISQINSSPGLGGGTQRVEGFSILKYIKNVNEEFKNEVQRRNYLLDVLILISGLTHKLYPHQTNLLLGVVTTKLLEGLVKRVALGILLEVEIDILDLVVVHI